MSPVRLMIVRELKEKVRSKAFLITNIILITLVLAVTTLPTLLGSDEADVLGLAVVGDRAQVTAELAQQQAPAFGIELIVTATADDAAARADVEAGDRDLALLSDDTLVSIDRPGRVVDLLDGARRVAVLDGALEDAGVPVGDRAALLQPTPLSVELLGDEDDGGTDFEEEAVLTGLAAVVMLYGLLIFYGQQVAQGLVQEKQSRVIEVLLAAVRPTQLLLGKLVGLGLLGLAQMAALGVAAIVGLRLTSRGDLPAESVPTIVAAVCWFLLGYAMYATLFALAAAVVAKVEDLQTAMAGPIVLLVGSLFVAQVAIADPDGALATYVGVLPPVAPIYQPLTVALGTASALTMAVSAVGVLLTTAALVPITARVHAGAALVTRQRISVREALRRSRD